MRSPRTIAGLCLAIVASGATLVCAPASAAAAGQIKFRGKSALGYAKRSSCAMPKPEGVQPGDRMLMQLYVEGPQPTTVSVAGWEAVQSVSYTGPGNTFALAVFTKVYKEGDPATYTATWTGTAARGCGGLAAAWSGVSKTEPINAHSGAAATGPSYIVRAPSTTTTKANSMVVMLGDWDVLDTATGPVGMERLAGPEGVIAQVLQPAPGPTGDKEAKTTKAEGNAGVLVALTPEDA